MTKIYQIDPSHTSISFSVKHMMISKVRGEFDKIRGVFNYDPQELSKSSVEVEIDVRSINTHDLKRDDHLRSPEFFDVEKYPTLNFKSTHFEKRGSGIYVTGDLTIHGVERSVQLEMKQPSMEKKDSSGNFRIGVSGKATIKRKDFGLNWRPVLEAGGVLVGDEIPINLEVQFIEIQ